MTDPIRTTSEAVRAWGALPMPVGDPVEPMSDERRVEIRKRVEAATPGPWWTDTLTEHDDSESVGVDAHGGKWIVPLGELDPADAEFMAHARTDVPTLLAEVERLKAELAKYVGKEPTVVEEMAYLKRCLDDVHLVCDGGEEESLRWENPLPVPEWVAVVREAADGERPEERKRSACPGFEKEYQGVSDAKRRLPDCKHCGQTFKAHEGATS